MESVRSAVSRRHPAHQAGTTTGRPTPPRRPACRGRGGAHPRGGVVREASARYGWPTAVNENLSLIVMCLFLLGSLAFLAQQLIAYR